MREAKLVSKNGINVYAYKNPALHGFQISLFLKAGALYGEGEYPGITHFFEHIAIRNVNKIMDMGLYRALDSRGLEFNAATYSEMVQFYIVGASEHFSFAKDVIIKLFSPIALSRAEIEAERKRIKAEIRESDDKNTLSSFTSGIAFADTSLSGSIVGTNSSVDKINAKRLEEYRRANMNAGSVFFYVTGNVSDGDLAELVRAAGELELPPAVPRDNIAPVPERFGKRENRVYVKSADFTMVRFTFDLDMSELSVPETDVIYDTLLGGYSSRMFIEMSEKRGLFYDISGGVERYSNIGTLHFSFELKERDVLTAVALVVDILLDFKRCNKGMIERARAGYVDNAMMLLDDVRELNFTFGYDNHVMSRGYGSAEERRAAYASLTAEDVSRAAEKIFKLKNLTFTMKGNKKKIKTDEISDILRRLE